MDATGNLFVADTGHNLVEKNVAPAYTSVVTLASGFSFNSPRGVAVDGSGDVFVADTGNHSVEEIAPACGTPPLRDLAGWKWGLHDRMSVALDGSGNLFVADTGYTNVLELAAHPRRALVFVARVGWKKQRTSSNRKATTPLPANTAAPAAHLPT